MDRRERRALARQILRHSPGLIEKIADEEGVSRARAKQLAVRYIAAGLGAPQPPETYMESEAPELPQRGGGPPKGAS